MTRECHVRFCERLQEQLLWPTHLFGMKVYIGADAEPGLVHHVHGTVANEAVAGSPNCCMAKKTRRMRTLDTSVSRNMKSMKIMRWSGKSRPPQHVFQAEQRQRALYGQAQD